MRVQFKGTFMVDNSLVQIQGNEKAAQVGDAAREERSVTAIRELDVSLRLRYVPATRRAYGYDMFRDYLSERDDQIVIERRLEKGGKDDYEELLRVDREMPCTEEKTPEGKFLRWQWGGKVIRPAKVGQTVAEFIRHSAEEAQKRWQLISEIK